MDPATGQDAMRIHITHDKSTTDLLWDIGKAKADWFRQNNWTSSLSRLVRFGLSVVEAEHYQQFLGLAGEAAVWQWLWGDLGEFWEQQAWLHESKALSDGGQDLPGLDVKTRDLIYHREIHQPDLLLTPHRINETIHYVLSVVSLAEPFKPLETDVHICGTISGLTVSHLQQRWFNAELKRLVIPQEELSPVQILRWQEHGVNQ